MDTKVDIYIVFKLTLDESLATLWTGAYKQTINNKYTFYGSNTCGKKMCEDK